MVLRRPERSVECSDSEKKMSACADQNHAPSLTCVRLEYTFCIGFENAFSRREKILLYNNERRNVSLGLCVKRNIFREVVYCFSVVNVIL